MLVLITYDVNTETAAGKSRLRKVAKQCVNYGRRVQNSVFECIVDQAQSVMLKAALLELIDQDTDSLRFYYLGNNYKTKVEHFGVEMPEKSLKIQLYFGRNEKFWEKFGKPAELSEEDKELIRGLYSQYDE